MAKDGAAAQNGGGEGRLVENAKEGGTWAKKAEEMVDGVDLVLTMVVRFYVGLVEKGGKELKQREGGEIVGLGLVAGGVVLLVDAAETWKMADAWNTLRVAGEAGLGWAMLSMGSAPVVAGVRKLWEKYGRKNQNSQGE